MANGDRLMTHRMYRELIVVSLGDIADGFEFYGPFENGHAALTWVKANVDPDETAKYITVNDVREPEDDDGQTD